MKKIISSLILVLLIQSIYALPAWINRVPSSNSETFYYRVTQAEGKDYNEAYTKAFAMAVLESQWKLGVRVHKNDNFEEIQNNISNSINVEIKNMNLPINKVCEYEKNMGSSNKIRLYVLWQVARYGNEEPNFEEFTNCDRW